MATVAAAGPATPVANKTELPPRVGKVVELSFDNTAQANMAKAAVREVMPEFILDIRTDNRIMHVLMADTSVANVATIVGTLVLILSQQRDLYITPRVSDIL